MFSINHMDKRPIYEQICDQLEELIGMGYYAPGENLPSIRQLAQELSINPNTISHAYAELEHRGILVSKPGKGSFVANRIEDIHKNKREKLTAQFMQAAQELQKLGVSAEKLTELLKNKINGGNQK